MKERSPFPLALLLWLVGGLLVLWVPRQGLAEAKVATSKDEVVWDSDFVFLTRFAFQSHGPEEDSGSIAVDLVSRSNLSTLLYFGSEDSWNSAYYNKTATCGQKMDTAFYRDRISAPHMGEYRLSRSFRIPFAPRKSYWFLAVSNCQEQQVQLSEYFVELRQGDGSHFSTNEKGLLVIYALFFVYYTVLCSIHFYAMIVLARVTHVHALFRLFSLAAFLEYMAVIFHLIDLSVYSKDGIGIPPLSTIGNFCEAAFEIAFLGLLLLISQGWTISREKISHPWAFFSLYGAYCAIYLVAFLFQLTWKDPASLKSSYQSAPGIFLLVWRCLSFIFFLYQLRVTYNAETQAGKRAFFRKFGFFFSLWFLMFPVLLSIITTANATVRDRLVASISATLNALSIGVMAYLLWPSRTYRYFKLVPLSAEFTHSTNTTPGSQAEALPYGSI